MKDGLTKFVTYLDENGEEMINNIGNIANAFIEIGKAIDYSIMSLTTFVKTALVGFATIGTAASMLPNFIKSGGYAIEGADTWVSEGIGKILGTAQDATDKPSSEFLFMLSDVEREKASIKVENLFTFSEEMAAEILENRLTIYGEEE